MPECPPESDLQHAYGRDYFDGLMGGWNRISQPIISALLARHCAGHVAVALDFGCGAGAYANALRARADRVEGCDVAEEAIQRSAGLYNHTRVIQGAEDLPTAAYDLIFSTEVLEHIPDYRSVLRHWKRALRPGGRLFLTTTTFAPSVWTMLYAVKNQGMGLGAALDGVADWARGLVSEPRADAFIHRWCREAFGGHEHGFAPARLASEVRAAGLHVKARGVFYAIEPLPLPFLHRETPFSIWTRDGWGPMKRIAATLLWLAGRPANAVSKAAGWWANNLWLLAERPADTR